MTQPVNPGLTPAPVCKTCGCRADNHPYRHMFEPVEFHRTEGATHSPPPPPGLTTGEAAGPFLEMEIVLGEGGISVSGGKLKSAPFMDTVSFSALEAPTEIGASLPLNEPMRSDTFHLRFTKPEAVDVVIEVLNLIKASFPSGAPKAPPEPPKGRECWVKWHRETNRVTHTSNYPAEGFIRMVEAPTKAPGVTAPAPQEAERLLDSAMTAAANIWKMSGRKTNPTEIRRMREHADERKAALLAEFSRLSKAQAPDPVKILALASQLIHFPGLHPAAIARVDEIIELCVNPAATPKGTEPPARPLTKPVVDGWYWYAKDEEWVGIEWVSVMSSRASWMDPKTEEFEPVPDGYKWAGPIPEPPPLPDTLEGKL